MSTGSADGEDGTPVRSMLVELPRGLVLLLGTAAAVITGAGISELSWLIGPVFMALTIVIVVSPLQSWLLRHGVPRWVALTRPPAPKPGPETRPTQDTAGSEPP